MYVTPLPQPVNLQYSDNQNSFKLQYIALRDRIPLEVTEERVPDLVKLSNVAF